MDKIERVGISLEKELLAQFDALIEKQGYSNRSEAVRDLIRARLEQDKLADPSADAVAAILLIYDHHLTGLTAKLTHLQHSHLLHIITSTHVHLDHHNCLEVIILKGKAGEIQSLADRMTSLKGVKLSRVNILAPDVDRVHRV
jgi:CopG family nickel-responsive transcriptional regulator